VTRLAAALVLACAASSNAALAAEPPPEPEPGFAILQDGDGVVYHGDEAPLRPGPGWLALDVVDGRWHLRPATLRGERAMDDVVGENTGVRLHADPPGASLYLRLPDLVAGKVDTPDMKFRGSPREMAESTALPLAFKGRTWRLDVRKGELFVSDGASSPMSLGRVVDPEDIDVGTALRWAGDLDRDGRLDFIFESTGKNSGTVCVWLSRLAKPGEPVGKAACWTTTGC
jgi:hypothetical protein